MNLDIAQKELDQRKAIAKRDGVTKAGREEMDKEQKRINSERGTVFGRMANGITDMKDTLKKGMGGVGKGALFGAAFMAIGLFLQSDYFTKITDFIFDTLIPKLKFFYDAFFGPEGGFINGFKEMFNDDSGIGSWVIAITGIVAAIVLFKFVGLALGIASLLGGLKGLGGKKGIGRFLGKGGMLKGAVTMFAGLGSSLKGFMGGITGFASKGLDMVKGAGAKLMESAKNMAKGALDLAKKGISAVKGGASAVGSGAKAVGGGVKDLGKAMGKDVAKGAGKVAGAAKGAGGKLAASAGKVLKMFPRLGLAAKLVPGLGAVLAAGQGISILMDDSMSKDDKIKAFGGLLGGSLGSAGFAALGAALGTAVFPGIGTIGGGLLGGVMGYFAGEALGTKAASFLLGEETEEEKVGKQLEGGGMSGGPPQSQGTTSGASFSSDATVGGTTGMDISQGSTKAKVSTYKGKPTESMISKRMKAGLDREQATSTPQEFDIMKPQGGMGNTTIINNNTTNAPVNNNSTTSTVNSIVESDPMFNRNSRYAI